MRTDWDLTRTGLKLSWLRIIGSTLCCSSSLSTDEGFSCAYPRSSTWDGYWAVKSLGFLMLVIITKISSKNKVAVWITVTLIELNFLPIGRADYEWISLFKLKHDILQLVRLSFHNLIFCRARLVTRIRKQVWVGRNRWAGWLEQLDLNAVWSWLFFGTLRLTTNFDFCLLLFVVNLFILHF